MLTVDQWAHFYRVRVVDYERAGDGLLIASGSGLMMAIMDAVPRMRWCVDIDVTRSQVRLEDFVIGATSAAGVVAFAGWFSITDPSRFHAQSRLAGDKARVYVGGERVSLGDFLCTLRGGGADGKSEEGGDGDEHGG